MYPSMLELFKFGISMNQILTYMIKYQINLIVTAMRNIDISKFKYHVILIIFF